MRKLYILRHAKSDWNSSYLGDHERPLSSRGRKAAARLGWFFSEAGELPDLILCSTSVRTRETLAIAAQAGEWPEIPVAFENELYLTSYDLILGRLRLIPETVESVMVIGHEPTSSVVASSLIGGASIHFPTAACARINLDIDSWAQVRSGCGVLNWMIPPKILKRIKK